MLAARLAVMMALTAGSAAWSQIQVAPPSSSCHVTERAQLVLRDYRGRFVTDLSINGQSVVMMVDTGASRTTISPGMAEVLGLQPNRRHLVRVNGVGGVSEPVPAMTARSIRFGVMEKLGYDLTVAGMGRSGEESDPQAPVGVLAADLLSAYEVQLDFPNRQMTLYSAPGCTADYLPWSPGYKVFDAIRTPQNALLIPVALDRHPMLAMIDTGAQKTSVGRDAVLATGVDAKVLDQEPLMGMSGANGLSVATHRHMVALTIGGATFSHVPVWVQDGSVKGAEMLLGMDFMRWRKLWISYQNKRVFMALAPRPSADRLASPALAEASAAPKPVLV